ncbi:MAG: type II toxin-antitoxin system RelB/DinJ family antitoxin [Oscillospiraceae bacterium]|nr:type II toxin-antitoxin system RelB/DinJ family antitoxin [Oscillospiraceae bacterium]
MAKTSLVQVRVDDDLKASADALFAHLGLDTQTAIRMFLRQSVMRDGLPFEVSADPFYSAGNTRALERSLRELRDGKTVTKTMDELRAMEQ